MAVEISNYYEPLVLSAIDAYLREHGAEAPVTPAMIEDAACLALNRLPARYVRHYVDAHFYASARDRADMDRAVEKAVREAFEHLYREAESGQSEASSTAPDHSGS